MRLLFLLLVSLGGIVFARYCILEATSGEAFRESTQRGRTARVLLPARRGRILARDGTILAADEDVDALAVHYRWLKRPARDQMSDERNELHRRLATVCGLTAAEWELRRAGVQTRVERIAASVNRRSNAKHVSQSQTAPISDSWRALVRSAAQALFAPPEELPPPEGTSADDGAGRSTG